MFLTYKNASIFYTDQGQGSPIILLHGFLENSQMWDFAITALAEKHRIICIDLPGHGKSDSLGYVHEMSMMSDVIFNIIGILQLNDITIVGHSMGGYVGCAFAKAYPEKLKALCLLNSTPLPDDEERKTLRARAIDMAKTKYKQLVQMSFTNLFDTQSRLLYKDDIKIALQDALKTPVQGFIAAHAGMAKREDYSKVWLQGNFKKGFILGEDDWIIDVNVITSKYLQEHTCLSILPLGHMSHITNPSSVLEKVQLFID